MVDESSKTNTISLDVEELYWSIRFRASSYTGLWLRYKAGNMAGKVECQIRQTDRVQVCILIGLGELYWYKISLYCYCQYNASKQIIEDQVS